MNWEEVLVKIRRLVRDVVIMLERDIGLNCSSWGEWKDGGFEKYLGYRDVRICSWLNMGSEVSVDLSDFLVWGLGFFIKIGNVGG